MYHVIGTSITTSILYLLSYYLYRAGFFSIQLHKKIWNIILASAFIITASAGLFLALQVSYKWEIGFVRTILKWHVEFGIGLAVTGLFHLLWHYSYFRRVFTNESVDVKTDVAEISSSEIRTSLFILGLVSSSVQLLLLRELINITGGYELITGTFLASWLITSSSGSRIAGRSALNNIPKINLIFSLSPLVSLLLLLVLGRLLLNPGQTPSFLVSLIYTFIVLLPFCFLSGFTFSRLVKVGNSVNIIPGKSFSIETAGGIIAGIIISVLASGLINTYQMLLIIIVLANAGNLLVYRIRKPFPKNIIKIIACLIVGALLITNPDKYFRQLLLPAVRITSTEDSPYGNITRGVYNGEESIYYNHRLMTYSNDVVEREENVHYTMLQAGKTDRVILLSGSLETSLQEILKYPVKEITFIERDPALTRLKKNYTDSAGVRIKISNSDAFSFIRKYKESADVILMLMPPPSTLLLNRYYTTEFFRNIKLKLESNGVFMCSPGTGGDYLNQESIRLYSSVYNSLKKAFRNVLIIQGQKLYFIASDNILSSSICSLTQQKRISNLYVGPDFLSDDLIGKKSAELTGLMDQSVKENRISFPVACMNFQSLNLSRSKGEKTPSVILMILLFAFPVLSVRRKNLPMYFTASALAGFEIIVLLILQIMIGNMYQLAGLIIAGLMAGLAAGAGMNIRRTGQWSIRTRSMILLVFYLVMGMIMNSLIQIKGELLVLPILLLISFIPGFLTGRIFRQLTGGDGKDQASEIYSSDLAGSASGFIIISGLMIPMIGIQLSVLFLSSLIFAGILFGTATNKL